MIDRSGTTFASCVPGCRSRQGPVGLDVEQARRRDVGGQNWQEPCQPVGTEGRIEQNQIVGLGLLAQEARGIEVEDGGVGDFEARARLLQALGSATIRFDQVHGTGTTRGRFQAQGAGAGKEIQDPASGKLTVPKMIQPVVEGLAHAIGRGTQAWHAGDWQHRAP